MRLCVCISNFQVKSHYTCAVCTYTKNPTHVDYIVHEIQGSCLQSTCAVHKSFFTDTWMNRTCITMYILSVVARGAVKWILSFLTLSACVEVFCWSSKCLRLVQGCVLTFKREKKTTAFSSEPQYILYACLFVCICWNIKVQVQNAYNVSSVIRLQRALCSLSTLKVEMFNI